MSDLLQTLTQRVVSHVEAIYKSVDAEVDYQEGLEGSRFIINNPNADTTCGCGASFSV